MLSTHGTTLDLQDPLRRFHRDGYARLGPVLDDDAAASLRERAEALMSGEVHYPGLFFQHDPASGRYADLSYGKGWVAWPFEGWIAPAAYDRGLRALFEVADTPQKRGSPRRETGPAPTSCSKIR